MTDWSGTRVLVTGAAGFIGSHLAERLVEGGAQVRAFDLYTSTGSWGWLDGSPASGDLEMVLGDVRDPDSVRRAVAGVDVVFHLAALIAIPYSYEAPQSYVDTNVTGTLNVLRAARDEGCSRVVHTSTSEVYGTARYAPIDEAHPLQGQSPYAASKIGADKMAEAFHLSFGLPVATMRPFNTYGPRQSARAVIPTIATQLLAGQPLHLGNLEPTRDLTYVADTVEGFLRVGACDACVGEVVNVGTGVEISIGALAQEVAAAVGAEASVVHDEQRVRPAGSEVERLVADVSKAEALLGWRPERPLAEGLRETVDWLQENLGRYRAGTYAV